MGGAGGGRKLKSSLEWPHELHQLYIASGVN